MKPLKILTYNYKKMSTCFTLNTSSATDIDPLNKRRIVKFQNVNFETLIGTEIYEKHNKFAFVVRQLKFNFTNQFSLIGTNLPIVMSVSNFRFENEPFLINHPVNTAVSVNNCISLHYYNPVYIGLSRVNNLGVRDNLETYTQYVFSKPGCPKGDIIISYSSMFLLELPSNYNPTGGAYPTISINCEIIPVLD
jgi:hypothetical protein